MYAAAATSKYMSEHSCTNTCVSLSAQCTTTVRSWFASFVRMLVPALSSAWTRNWSDNTGLTPNRKILFSVRYTRKTPSKVRDEKQRRTSPEILISKVLQGDAWELSERSPAGIYMQTVCLPYRESKCERFSLRSVERKKRISFIISSYSLQRHVAPMCLMSEQPVCHLEKKLGIHPPDGVTARQVTRLCTRGCEHNPTRRWRSSVSDETTSRRGEARRDCEKRRAGVACGNATVPREGEKHAPTRISNRRDVCILHSAPQAAEIPFGMNRTKYCMSPGAAYAEVAYVSVFEAEKRGRCEDHRASKIERRHCHHALRRDLILSSGVWRTVARAGVEIEMKFISNRRNWRFEISIRDQQPSSTNANLKENVYMEKPPDLEKFLHKIVIEVRDSNDGELFWKSQSMLENFKCGKGEKVCLLKRALYGLKQTGRQWCTKLNVTLKYIGFILSTADPCIYSSFTRGEKKNGKPVVEMTNWTACPIDRKSYTGFYFQYAGGTNKTTLFNNNQAAQYLSVKPIVSSKSKHIAKKEHFLREVVQHSDIVIKYRKSEDMEADLFTKALLTIKHAYLIVPDDAARRKVFSGISLSPCIPALFHTHLTSLPRTLKTTMSIAAQISPLHIALSPPYRTSPLHIATKVRRLSDIAEMRNDWVRKFQGNTLQVRSYVSGAASNVSDSSRWTTCQSPTRRGVETLCLA
ncbi:hypothetical protein PR048_008628 [Dryococelus australis]|uniref:Reverse transcriptase Ty1/copia-type domain-containing protein n=1 Tax=Dryococelus australis TaxID=614101 RepID=A0ABQ9HYH3_9NEOP|nr:hypothetical protein PR048_008628 [Dryococelus australis]